MGEFRFYLKQNSVKPADVTFDWLRAEYQPTKLLRALLATSTDLVSNAVASTD